MAFATEYRPKVIEQNPEVTFGEVSKLVGNAWSQVKKEDRKLYERMADDDKVRHEKEMEEWRKTQKPKKPLSAYMEFVKSERSTIAHKDADFATVSRTLGAAWRDMPEESKAFFQQKADQDKVRFETEMAVWLAANPDKVKVKPEKKVKKEEKVLVEKVVQDVEMPALEAV